MQPHPNRIVRQHTRADTRVDFFNRVRVFAQGKNKCIKMLSENISCGGIFVCGIQILPAGSRVVMEVETKRRGLLWVEDAEVIWNKPIRRTGLSVLPGMGVKFVRVSPRSRKLIEEEVNTALTSRPEPGRVRRVAPVPQPAREATRDISPSRSKHYLIKLLVAIVLIVVGAFLLSLIHPRSQSPVEPARVAPATALPKAAPKVVKPVVNAEVKDPPSVALPVFSKTTDGWQMVLQATAPVRIKHFKLKNPPRLVFDLHKAHYTGDQKRLSSPAPFVSRLRVGKQSGVVRFVLDFKGEKVPRHRVAKDADRAVVRFY